MEGILQGDGWAQREGVAWSKHAGAWGGAGGRRPLSTGTAVAAKTFQEFVPPTGFLI